MGAGPLEKTIVKQILAWLNSMPECYARKRHGGMANPGEPDITACLSGRRIEIEVKRPGGKPTALQLHQLDQWRKAGALAFVAYSLEEVKGEMERAGLLRPLGEGD